MAKDERDFRHVLQEVKHYSFNRRKHTVHLRKRKVVQHHRREVIQESLSFIKTPVVEILAELFPVQPGLSSNRVLDILQSKCTEHLPGNLAAIIPANLRISIDYLEEGVRLKSRVEIVLGGEMCRHGGLAKIARLPDGVQPRYS